MAPVFVTEIALFSICAVTSFVWSVISLIPCLYDQCIGAETQHRSATKKTLQKNRISFKKRIVQRVVVIAFAVVWLGTVLGANLVNKVI